MKLVSVTIDLKRYTVFGVTISFDIISLESNLLEYYLIPPHHSASIVFYRYYLFPIYLSHSIKKGVWG